APGALSRRPPRGQLCGRSWDLRGCRVVEDPLGALALHGGGAGQDPRLVRAASLARAGPRDAATLAGVLRLRLHALLHRLPAERALRGPRPKREPERGYDADS